MEDKNPKPMKAHKMNSEVQTHHANTSKLVSNFLLKATIFTVFLVTLSLVPSVLPEFINLKLNPRSWELLQVVCVGIAFTYGLFSKKNEGNHHVEKEDHNYSPIDNANSYITRLVQVSSVVDDEVENHPSVSDDDREESSNLEEETAISSRINEKPFLLPARRLNNSGSKRFAGISRGDEVRKRPQQQVEEDSSSMEDFDLEFRRMKSTLPRRRKIHYPKSLPPPPPPPPFLHNKPPLFKSKSGLSKHKEEEKIVVETGSETDSENEEEDGFEGSFGKHESDHEGPAVDQKADDFIQKFRQHLRLEIIQDLLYV